jgi:nucleoid-associated protein YgaU/DNA-binding SARP family transcriptional activator
MTIPRSTATPTERRTRPRPTVPELARGAMAFVVLLALVLGMPAALWGLGRALRLFEGLGTSNLASALTSPDDGSLFLAALLLVAWVAWLVFAVSVALELVAFVRGVPTPRLPWLKLPQQGAAALVATAALLVTSGTALLSAPVARPVSVAADFRDPSGGRAPVAVESKAAASMPVTEASRHHPTVAVRRHDTLWSLAESHLGSGERFREIVALNLGRPQPDGRALTDARWVYPGWVLQLPTDARMTSESRAAGYSVSVEVYTVQPGDTLSEIAADELGDGHRYGEVYDLNQGRRQSDGLKLSDPDEIQPGWRLTLPVASDETGRGAGVLKLPPGPPPATVQPPEQSVPSLAASGAVPTAVPNTSHGAELAPARAGADGNDSAALSLGLGLGTIAATGLTWELRRRRRLQQANRRLGERIGMPEADRAAVEARVTTTASPVTVETVRNALRALMASCLAAKKLLPDVVLVRVSPSSLALELRNDDLEAVAPFVAVTARTWRLEEPTLCRPAGPDPYPALVTLGVDGDDVLLLNLESVGTLRLRGPAARVDDALRAFAVDLAVGPLSGAATLTFAACFPELARTLDPGRARHVISQQAEREIAVRTETTQKLLAASDAQDVRGARSLDVATDATVPEIVVTDRPLQECPSAWSGASAVVVDEGSADAWAVVLDTKSGATLQPLGLPFEPQALSQVDYEQVVSLLTTAQMESTPPPASAEEADERAVVSSALPAVPATVLDLRDDVPAPPRVLVLGKVYVERADDEAAPNRRRRATELIAYLALHPGASAHEIDEALWPGKRIEKTTRNPFISRARQWLGRSAEGEPYLPLAVDGGNYQLRPDVSCDWHDFVRFSQLGLTSGADGDMALAAALDLVRGRPFLGVDPATYTWAEADAQEMISAVVDVAHVLAVTRCDTGDYRGAQEAAARGLLAEPCSELLYRDAIRAAAAAGDKDEVERLAARLRHEIALVDPEELLDEVTTGLVDSLVSSV